MNMKCMEYYDGDFVEDAGQLERRAAYDDIEDREMRVNIGSDGDDGSGSADDSDASDSDREVDSDSLRDTMQ